MELNCPKCGAERVERIQRGRIYLACRPCQAAYAKERYARGIGRFRTYDHQKKREANRRHYEKLCSNGGAAVRKRWANGYALKYSTPEGRFKERARCALKEAVRSGKIIRPDKCSKCGVACKPHGHHTDYSKRLDVVWLCASCHGIAHRRFPEGEVAAT